jgi:hypothetical protein
MVKRGLAIVALCCSGCSLLGLDDFDCDRGYVEDETGACVNVDECLLAARCGRTLTGSETGINACTDNHGGYACVCGPGFVQVGGSDAPDCAAIEPALLSLVSSQGTLSPAFDPATTSYELVVADPTWRLGLTPTVRYPADMTITVEEVSVRSGVLAPVPLSATPRDVSIVVGTQFGGSRTYTVRVPPLAITYFKPDDTDPSDAFGFAVAMSEDGSTLAVGMTGDDSGSRGIGGDPADESVSSSGAVYVFRRSDGAWAQEAYIKASNTDADDEFGYALALNGDGSVLAVSAPHESSSARGIDGNEDDDSVAGAGAVYVFRRTGAAWAQEAYVKASNPGIDDAFGAALDLDGVGDVLAVSASFEDSSSAGIDGDESNDLSPDSGAAYVFRRESAGWRQEAYVKASVVANSDWFGSAVAFSGDGTRLAVGAVNGSSETPGAGDVFVFVHDSSTWLEETHLFALNADVDDGFGYTLALDRDGTTLAVTAPGESSDARGIDGDPNNDDAFQSGAAYLFARSGTTWTLDAYVKALNADAGDLFGHSIALSSEGDTLVVGSIGEQSGSEGWDGEPFNNLLMSSGAAYLFERQEGAWGQTHYLKAPNPNDLAQFGFSIAMSGDADSIAVGAIGEPSAATGINGDLDDVSWSNVGAVYVY